jgi:hypothetical protein
VTSGDYQKWISLNYAPGSAGSPAGDAR